MIYPSTFRSDFLSTSVVLIGHPDNRPTSRYPYSTHSGLLGSILFGGSWTALKYFPARADYRWGLLGCNPCVPHAAQARQLWSGMDIWVFQCLNACSCYKRQKPVWSSSHSKHKWQILEEPLHLQ